MAHGTPALAHCSLTNRTPMRASSASKPGVPGGVHAAQRARRHGRLCQLHRLPVDGRVWQVVLAHLGRRKVAQAISNLRAGAGVGAGVFVSWVWCACVQQRATAPTPLRPAFTNTRHPPDTHTRPRCPTCCALRTTSPLSVSLGRFIAPEAPPLPLRQVQEMRSSLKNWHSTGARLEPRHSSAAAAATWEGINTPCGVFGGGGVGVASGREHVWVCNGGSASLLHRAARSKCQRPPHTLNSSPRRQRL